ncbi:MAG: hypothetical protein EAZ60_12000 [Oscillatoriales cyanobacterium]|nr:MAG: hypothetical protein EAZ83_27820 [Oscillatoriales cyanobacterium]TAE94407.1 MAG: hypothetical protein EAZ79_23285 [Oscillatoriales cyanobacterium]TAF14786.1 MAG: hypothetical protein EAZ73_28210 [Oscillatoriales cyanobacterium]TAF26362.1 MAG: hypothetical protein EAZ69_29130 [Oscillatoriales cyanobacterium]TAF55767.1 MAG: hypothetical protein EAZ60_12000 [Oscillatoriales cyanobacterium]
MLDRVAMTAKVEICPPGSKSARSLFFPKNIALIAKFTQSGLTHKARETGFFSLTVDYNADFR